MTSIGRFPMSIQLGGRWHTADTNQDMQFLASLSPEILDMDTSYTHCSRPVIRINNGYRLADAGFEAALKRIVIRKLPPIDGKRCIGVGFRGTMYAPCNTTPVVLPCDADESNIEYTVIVIDTGVYESRRNFSVALCYGELVLLEGVLSKKLGRESIWKSVVYCATPTPLSERKGLPVIVPSDEHGYELQDVSKLIEGYHGQTVIFKAYPCNINEGLSLKPNYGKYAIIDCTKYPMASCHHTNGPYILRTLR